MITRLKEATFVIVLYISVTCVMLSMTDHAHAKSWEQAIQDVEALQEKYIQEIQRRTGERPSLWQGAMNDARDAHKHLCAILGRRHGFASFIAHLEPPQPSFSAPTHELELNLPSLSNWLSAARTYGDMKPFRRAKYWNIECVGNMGIPNGLWQDIPKEVWFQVSGDHLLIYGDIISGFFDRLVGALHQNPHITTISMGSGGGNVQEALRAGRFIREKGLNTQLYGSCMSACPLVFMGGINRSIFRDSERFGFHKASINGDPVLNSSKIYREIWSYVTQMGGNGDAFLMAMQSAEPYEMKYYPAWIECGMGLGTWYQGFQPGECPPNP